MKNKKILQAPIFLAEEEAVQDVLRAEKELADGKILNGDLRKLIKKLISFKK